MLLLMVARRIFLGNDLNGLSVLSSTLRTSILGTCAALSTVAATSRWPATRCDPAGPMFRRTHRAHLFCRPWRVLAGQTLIGGTITGCRQVMSDPTRQVEQICRSTARLNPACPHEEPHTVVLVSPTRVRLAGQARARTSSTSRSEEPIYLVVLRRRQSAHVLATASVCSPPPLWRLRCDCPCMGAVQHACGPLCMLFCIGHRFAWKCRSVIRMAFGCPA